MSLARRRLEIVHESLLTKWPRLSRWRAQDEEGAVLRDQLRQAAQVWEQHGQVEDFLWTGTAFREYQLWRERYPGGLTAREEAFAVAMNALAQRRRRRRRLAVAAVMTALAAGLAVFAVLRQQAVAQARRAEASKLLAFGQLQLETNATAALAYAIKSLELDDSRSARLFALTALAAAPPAFVHLLEVRETGAVRGIVFSPDGAWAAVLTGDQLQVMHRDGAGPLHLSAFPAGSGQVSAVFDSASQYLYAAKDGMVRIWRAPHFDLLETQTVGGTHTSLRSTERGVLATTRTSDEPREVVVAALAAGAEPQPVARIKGLHNWSINRAGDSLAFARDNAIYVRSLTADSDSPRRIGTYTRPPGILFHPAGDLVAAYDSDSRSIRLWASKPGSEEAVRSLPAPFEPLNHFTFDRAGRRLAALGNTERGWRVDLWDLDAPADATPTRFPPGFGTVLDAVAFSPDGRWLTTTAYQAVCFWPLTGKEPRILRGHRVGVTDVRFTPDGHRLVSVDRAGEVREWVLEPGAAGRTLARVNLWSVLDMDRQGRFAAVLQREGVLIVPLGGGETRQLKGFAPSTWPAAVAIDREGRRVAAASGRGARQDKVIRVWDLDTGAVRILGPTENAGEGTSGQVLGLGFLADGSLVSAGDGGLRRWSLTSGAHEVIAPSFFQSHLTVFPDGRSVIYTVGGESVARSGTAETIASVSVVITDLTTRTSKVLGTHAGRIMPMAVHPSGRFVVTGAHDGIVRVGGVGGEEPHLLIGHEGWVHTVDVSPDGRWIASAGDDRTVRLWPMPDLSRPPLHTLPRAELLTKLKSLTNLRVVEESESTWPASLRIGSGTGYEVLALPFTGWAQVPTW